MKLDTLLRAKRVQKLQFLCFAPSSSTMIGRLPRTEFDALVSFIQSCGGEPNDEFARLIAESSHLSPDVRRVLELVTPIET